MIKKKKKNTKIGRKIKITEAELVHKSQKPLKIEEEEGDRIVKRVKEKNH